MLQGFVGRASVWMFLEQGWVEDVDGLKDSRGSRFWCCFLWVLQVLLKRFRRLGLKL